MAATQSAREAQKEDLRKQADEAVEAAAAALQRQAQTLAAKLEIPLSEMPSANAAGPRSESPQTPADAASSEDDSQENSGEAARGGEKADDSAAKDNGAETAEDAAFEMDELTDAEGDSLFPSWFRFPGFHSGEAEAEGWKDVPPEYRGLVRDYFRKLSEQEDSRE